MNYKDVEPARSSGSSTPAISITKDAFRLNKAGQSQFAIGGFTHAKFQRSEDDENKVAIKLLAQEEPFARTFKEGVLSARSWIKPLNLPLGEYPVTFDESEGLLEFDLTQRVKPAASAPAKPKIVNAEKKAA